MPIFLNFNYNLSDASYIPNQVITRVKLLFDPKQWFDSIITRAINSHFYDPFYVILNSNYPFYVCINLNSKNYQCTS